MMMMRTTRSKLSHCKHAVEVIALLLTRCCAASVVRTRGALALKVVGLKGVSEGVRQRCLERVQFDQYRRKVGARVMWCGVARGCPCGTLLIFLRARYLVVVRARSV
jgi:hypothetical protein